MEVGDYQIEVIATDTTGASVSQNFDFTVENVNDAPEWRPVGEITAVAGSRFAWDFSTAIVDADNYDTHVFELTTATDHELADWLEFDEQSGVLSSSQLIFEDGNDQFEFLLTAIDSEGERVSEVINFRVSEAETPQSICLRTCSWCGR